MRSPSSAELRAFRVVLSMAAALVHPGQPWHLGERTLQLQQKTVASSDEMGPRIYHKVIPESYQDMISPQPHFMASFLGEDGRVWPSAFFAPPGFALPQHGGRQIQLNAQLDPRDGAAVNGLVKNGTLMGGVTIDFMSRRRNRFNGQLELNGSGNAMKILQAFGNCPKYITRRRLRRTGQNLGGVTAGEAQQYQQLSSEDAALLEKTDMMYLGTGHPEHGADMNIRGGQAGFMRSLADGQFLAWPDYVGNGFYMSLGNTKLNPQAGVLVVDWDDTGRGLQILGKTETYEREEIQQGQVPAALVPGLQAMLEDEPQALRLVVIKVEIVRSIPQYCPHQYEKVELSPYNPTPMRELKSGAKSHEFDARVQWAKPESEDVITFEFQLAPIPRPGSLKLKAGQHVRLGIPALSKDGMPVERTWTVTSEPSWFHEHGRFQISVQHKKDGLVTPFLHQKLALNKVEESESVFIFHGFSGEFSPLLEPSGEYRLQKQLPKHIVFFAGGIGVTPAIAALKGIIDQPGEERAVPESFTLFYSFRDLRNAAFLGYLLKQVQGDLQAVAPETKLKVVINITNKDAKMMIDQLHASVKALTGRQDVLLLPGRLESFKEHLPFTGNDVEGFVCGPAAFEQAALGLWSAAGLPAGKLRTESFAY